MNSIPDKICFRIPCHYDSQFLAERNDKGKFKLTFFVVPKYLSV